MANSSKNENGFLWRTIRRVIFALLSQAARKVLLNRMLLDQNGNNLRWMAADVSSFLQKTKSEANRIRPIANLHSLPLFGNKVMVELAIMTAAAYRTMYREGIDAIDAQKTVADIGWIIYSKMLGLTALPFRLVSRDPGRRLRGTIKLLLKFPFGAPGAPGYAVKSWTENGDIYTYFTHCPPQSFVRSLIAEKGDNGELDAFYQSWCLYDWPGADVIAADGIRGHYLRKKTLSKGDSVCDMCWARKASGDACHQHNVRDSHSA